MSVGFRLGWMGVSFLVLDAMADTIYVYEDEVESGRLGCGF